MNVSQHQYLNKYSATFLIFNIFVYSLWIAEVISTALVKSSLQVSIDYRMKFLSLIIQFYLSFHFVGPEDQHFQHHLCLSDVTYTTWVRVYWCQAVLATPQQKIDCQF